MSDEYQRLSMQLRHAHMRAEIANLKTQTGLGVFQIALGNTLSAIVENLIAVEKKVTKEWTGPRD